MKFEIDNRYGLNIVGEVLYPHQTSIGLAFIQHGLSGACIQKHIQKMADTFLSKNYTVVLFDATHSFGESGGDLKYATLSNHADDLEDVIGWASKQSFYKEPFVLAGHSLGGGSILRYVTKYPSKVKAMAPLSAVSSGEMLKEAWSDGLDEWKSTGYFIKKCSFKEDLEGKVSWEFMEDAVQYDFTKFQYDIPTLLVVGKDDETTPISMQYAIQNKVKGGCGLYIIEGCGHTFKSPEHLVEMASHLSNWLDAI